MVSTIEQWIRAKYERKQFAAPGPFPDPDTITDTRGDGNTNSSQNNDLIQVQSKQDIPIVPNIQKSQAPIQVKATASPMDDLFSAFQGQPASQTAIQSGAKVVDFKSNILSLYANPTSAPASRNSSVVATNSSTSDFADFANFSQFKVNSQPEAVPKKEGGADFDFFSASSPPKSAPKKEGGADYDFFSASSPPKSATSTSVSQSSHRNNSLLDIDSVDSHKPPPSTLSKKPLEIDFASFSISKNEIPKASSVTPANVSSIGFSSNSTNSSLSHKMDPGLFNHWGDPEPPKQALPQKTSLMESSWGDPEPPKLSSPLKTGYVDHWGDHLPPNQPSRKASLAESSTVGSISHSFMDSPAMPLSSNETNVNSFSDSRATTLPVTTNSVLDENPWSDFQ